MDHNARSKLLRITSPAAAIAIARNLAADFKPAPSSAAWIGDRRGVMADVFILSPAPGTDFDTDVVAQLADRAARLGPADSAVLFWCNIGRHGALALWTSHLRRLALARDAGLDVKQEVLVANHPVAPPLPISRQTAGKWVTTFVAEPTESASIADLRRQAVRSTKGGL